MNSPGKILVLDDIEDWRKTAQGLLDDQGYITLGVVSAEQAHKKLMEDDFVLAIIDMRLDEQEEGNKAGKDLCRQLRMEYPEIKLVMLTGYGDSQDAEEMRIQRVVDRFVEKEPNMDRVLLQVVNDLIGRPNFS